MTKQPWKEIAARAWDLRPSWWENAFLAVIGVVAMWWLDIAWWRLAIGYTFAYTAIFGLLGWLDLENEAADLREAEEALKDLGNPTDVEGNDG